jgi:hypothetical protein
MDNQAEELARQRDKLLNRVRELENRANLVAGLAQDQPDMQGQFRAAVFTSPAPGLTSRPVPRHDWSLEDPPSTVATPWATVLARLDSGLYREPETGIARSLAAWLDLFARHGETGRPTWTRSPSGRLFIVEGDRFVFLHDEGRVLVGWDGGVSRRAGGGVVGVVGAVRGGAAAGGGVGARAASSCGESLGVDVRIPLARQDARVSTYPLV